MQQITENSLNVCANGITSEEISEIRNCIRRIARRRELEGKKLGVRKIYLDKITHHIQQWKHNHNKSRLGKRNQ